MRYARVLFGPPGTGKSTYIIQDIRKMVDDGFDPGRIGVFSFTKAAANELAKRAGISEATISTIHGMCFRLADLSREQVVNNADLRKFGNLVKIPITGSNPEEGEFAEVGDAYLSLHAKLRTEERYPQDIKEGFIESGIDGVLWQFKHFCKNYDKWKEANGVIDFTDMLELALGCDNPDIDLMYVDESQDLSKLQWRLIYKWSASIEYAMVAGDDDQSIYVWGGADPSGMARFAKDFRAAVTVLGQSYRIPALVHRMALNVISNITGDRTDKQYDPTEREGEIGFHSDAATVINQIEPGRDTLVLYRNHSLREDIEDSLIMRGIPYVVQSGKPGVLQSMYAKAATLWIKITAEWGHHGRIVTPSNMLKPLIKLAKPSISRKVSDGDLTGVSDYHWSQAINIPGPKALYLKKVERSKGSLNLKPDIRLSTIHGSKGQEADHVVVVNGMTERTYDAMEKDFDSEVRTFYVGITRAKHRLDVVTAQNPVAFLGANNV